LIPFSVIVFDERPKGLGLKMSVMLLMLEINRIRVIIIGEESSVINLCGKKKI
jgi:hypothetical protein